MTHDAVPWGESASLATEYGTFPLYPAVRLVEVGHERDSISLQAIGYGFSAPLFVIAAPFAMLAPVSAPCFIRGPNASTLKMEIQPSPLRTDDISRAFL